MHYKDIIINTKKFIAGLLANLRQTCPGYQNTIMIVIMKYAVKNINEFDKKACYDLINCK